MKEIPGYRNLSPFIVPKPCAWPDCRRDGIYFVCEEGKFRWDVPMYCEFHTLKEVKDDNEG